MSVTSRPVPSLAAVAEAMYSLPLASCQTGIVGGADAGFCAGRRPLGHRDSGLAVEDEGSWFAVHAHLEAAAVGAFAELAAWLDARGAPPELFQRCHAARRDELRHARLMAAQARKRGAEVPMPSVVPQAEGLLQVAMHNAVEGCVSEAFAAVIAAHQARAAASEELRELFMALAKDELRHGQLAWDLDAWLLAQLDPGELEQVEQARRRALQQLPARASEGALRTPAALGWPVPAQAAALALAFAEQLELQRAA